MSKPTALDAIFDEADMARVAAARPIAVQEADLMHFPAGAWGDLLDRVGLPDLAARARAELAPAAGAGLLAEKMMGPEHNRSGRALR